MQINNSFFNIFPYSMARRCIFHLYLIKVIVFHDLYKVLVIFLFYKNINIVMDSRLVSKQCIYTPTTIKKRFNLRIYRKSKNLFCICYTYHIITSTNSYLSNTLIVSFIE